MTHLCYTLDEAAEKLNLSETVLVRLSQYFKMPKAAYEEAGYLSFKGDLEFSEQDMGFFRQIKERLLAGESLDEVKARLRSDDVFVPGPVYSSTHDPVLEATPVASKVSQTPAWEASEPVMPVQPKPGWQAALRAQQKVAPVPEYQDEAPMKKVAKRNFERYKEEHRPPSLGQVFKKMMQEVGGVSDKPSRSEALPDLKPLREKTLKKAPLPQEPVPLADTEVAEPMRLRITTPGKKHASRNQSLENAWEHLLAQAHEQPRQLNSQLKTAAGMLKDRALHQAQQPKPAR